MQANGQNREVEVLYEKQVGRPFDIRYELPDEDDQKTAIFASCDLSSCFRICGRLHSKHYLIIYNILFCTACNAPFAALNQKVFARSLVQLS